MPDIVLIHGFASDRMSWAANSAALAQVATVHVLDLPGHGDSGMDVGDGSIEFLANAVATAMAAKGILRAHLAGHSLGGAVALALAARNPPLVASLILIAPLGLGKGVDPEFLAGLTEATEAGPLLATLHRLVTRPHLINKLLATRLLGHLARDGARDAWRKLAAAMVAAELGDIRRHANALPPDLPKCVIWGTEDAINPVSGDLQKQLGVAPCMITNAGHLPHIERADIVNPVLTGFLRDHGGAR